MAPENTFDIVSKIDLQEVDNAIQQSLKEIRQRYDFKGSISDIRREKENVHLVADDQHKLRAVTEILLQKLSARRVPAKGLTFKTPEPGTGDSLKQQVVLQQGIPQEQAKEIVKILKSSGLKVQASIQGDQVRVKAKSKDELQGAIKMLRESSLNFDMQFTNYR